MDASAQSIKRIDFVLNRSQIEEPIRPIERYRKDWPIETNRPNDRGWLIGEAESACDQVNENDGSARPMTLARAKTNWEAINRTISITANIADGIGWGSESARSLDQGLEVWNWLGTSSLLKRPDTQEVGIER